MEYVKFTFFPIYSITTSFNACVCQRPYHVENTGSRPITAVKQRWAWLVLGWVTAWEHHVLLAFTFFQFLKKIFSLLYSKPKHVQQLSFSLSITNIVGHSGSSTLDSLLQIRDTFHNFEHSGLH